MIQQWLGFSLAFNGDKYVLLALGTVIYSYGGLPFLKGMIGEVNAKAIGMMTLVAIAISVAYVYSVAVVFGLQALAGNAFPNGCFTGFAIIGCFAA
jgi:Cu2+-exporting ATPase